MSVFDPATFLDATVSQPFTARSPLPEGDYVAVVNDVVSRNWTGVKDPTKSGVALDVTFTVEVPFDLQKELGLATSSLKMTDSILLDLTLNGAIDDGPGKNRKLGQYREAVDLNKKGDEFTIRQLVGKNLKVKVKHNIWEGKIQEKVSGVTKL